MGSTWDGRRACGGGAEVHAGVHAAHGDLGTSRLHDVCIPRVSATASGTDEGRCPERRCTCAGHSAFAVTPHSDVRRVPSQSPALIKLCSHSLSHLLEKQAGRSSLCLWIDQGLIFLTVSTYCLQYGRCIAYMGV